MNGNKSLKGVKRVGRVVMRVEIFHKTKTPFPGADRVCSVGNHFLLTGLGPVEKQSPQIAGVDSAVAGDVAG